MEWDSGDSSSEGKEAFVVSYEEKVAPYLSDDAQGPPPAFDCVRATVLREPKNSCLEGFCGPVGI